WVIHVAFAPARRRPLDLSYRTMITPPRTGAVCQKRKSECSDDLARVHDVPEVERLIDDAHGCDGRSGLTRKPPTPIYWLVTQQRYSRWPDPLTRKNDASRSRRP